MMASGISIARVQARHLVDVEVQPVGQQDEFRRDDGQVFPREHAHQREVELGKRVAARDAAQPQDRRARLAHPRGLRAVPGQFQREIRLHARVDLARPAVIDIPAAIGQLPTPDVPHALSPGGRGPPCPANACRARNPSTGCCPPSARPPNSPRAIAGAAGCPARGRRCVGVLRRQPRAAERLTASLPWALGRRMILGIRNL